MSEPAKRSTIYLDPELHRALRLKALDSQDRAKTGCLQQKPIDVLPEA
jgi:hypothetical protein